MEQQGETSYLSITQAIECYAEQFGCSLKQAADQIRNRDGLLSALARPEFYSFYQEADLAMQAAVLAHGVAETQPFLEGNKRTALCLMLSLLALNGYGVSASQYERMQWMVDLSNGLTPERLAERIRAALVAIVR